MRVALTIARRELAGYFSTPLAYVFLVAFIAAAGASTFYFGHFMENRQADLTAFFDFHPWLYLILVPAVGMRLWAEERRQGTIELLMTVPITPWQTVLGKFIAAWLFVGIALALTFPIWVTVNYLGNPDNGLIVAGYLASLLMAGTLMAVTSFASALTKSQVVAFVFGVVASFLLMMSGLDVVLNVFQGWAPQYVLEVVASFSLLTHFYAIAQGVLDLPAITFFIALMLLFLFLTRQVVAVWQQTDRVATAVAGAVVAVILFVSVTLISSLSWSSARVDLTADKVYTVSPSTRQVLSEVTEPILLRFYLSSGLVEEAPELRAYTTRVRELLRSYEQLSGGKVRVEQIDPVPFSAAEDEAIGFNLTGFNLSRTGDQGYIGMVGTNSVDRIETIRALDTSRESYLEYDLTRMVLRLSRPDEPKIGVIDQLGLFGDPQTGLRPAASIERLAADFDLVQIGPNATAIPDGLDALVIIHPHDLTESALYAIDQYAIRGGPVLVFLDVFAEHSPPANNNPAMPMYPDSSLGPLMATWGVQMIPKKIVGDLDMALQVRGFAGGQVVIAKYPPWLIVDRDNLDPNDVVTGQLSLMRMQTSGSLTQTDGATTTFAPLIRSTTNSMLFDQDLVMSRMDPSRLLGLFKPAGTQNVLAARITGSVDTAFPGGPPLAPQSTGDTPPPPPPTLISHSVKPLNVIMIADTDILGDEMNVDPNTGRQITQNTDFVINALDSLGGGGELIALRSHGVTFRPFVTVDRIEAAANAKYHDTEQKLQADLKDAQDKLAAMRNPTVTPQSGSAGISLEGDSAEQQKTIAQVNQRIVDVRQQLRSVRGALRAEIDELGDRLRLINIVAVPLVIVLIGIGVPLWRSMRLSRYLRRRSS